MMDPPSLNIFLQPHCFYYLLQTHRLLHYMLFDVCQLYNSPGQEKDMKTLINLYMARRCVAPVKNFTHSKDGSSIHFKLAFTNKVGVWGQGWCLKWVKRCLKLSYLPHLSCIKMKPVSFCCVFFKHALKGSDQFFNVYTDQSFQMLYTNNEASNQTAWLNKLI